MPDLTLSRRHFLSLAAALPGVFAFGKQISTADDAFLEDLSHRAFLFFWEHGDPTTGLVLDRVRNDGSTVPGRNLEVASTALTGFGLTAMCIAADRRWMDPNLPGKHRRRLRFVYQRRKRREPQMPEQESGGVTGSNPKSFTRQINNSLRSEERRVGKECRSRWS